MKPLVSPLAVLFCVAAGLMGCGKKPRVQTVAPEASRAAGAEVAAASPAAEEAAPASEQPASEQPGAAPGEPSEAVVAGAGTVVAPPPAALAIDGVPAGLIAGDRAYEAWFKKHGLDLNDPRMLDADVDNDGSTNREEFMADTDPHNAESRPGIHKVMRLKSYKEVRVPLMLESVSGHTAKIKRQEGGEAESVREGQMVGGLKVARIRNRQETDKNGQPVDLSRVDLEDPATKAKVVLVKDLPAKSAASYAVLTSAAGGTLEVRQGDTFSWPADKSVSYTVVDLRADQVVVQEVGSGRMWTIPRK